MWGTSKQAAMTHKQINHTRIEDDKDIEEFYRLGKCLGKGSFGTVLQARDVNTGNEWAIKAINKEKAGSAAVKLLEREVGIMKRVHHPNIIHLEEVYESSKKMFLVMEVCELGGLDELLKQKGFFTEMETRCIMKQLAGAIAYLHNIDIIHRDLKLENILLCCPVEEDQPINIKLTDFGLSYVRGGTGSDYMMQQVCGTPIYMAPEVIDSLGYSQQCDIWSMGVIMFTLVTGSPPFFGLTEDQLYEAIRAAELDFSHAQWQDYNAAARLLVEGMVKKDPAHRFTSKEVLNHSWLTGENSENGQVVNVLEMMKLFSLEQRMAKKELGDQIDNNVSDEPVPETPSNCPGNKDTDTNDDSVSKTVGDSEAKEDINANKIDTCASSSRGNSKNAKGEGGIRSAVKSRYSTSKAPSSRSNSTSGAKSSVIPDQGRQNSLDKKSGKTGTLLTKNSGTTKNNNSRPKEVRKR